MAMVDIWGIESRIYPLIDKANIEGKNQLKETFELGKGYRVDVKINNFSGSPLNNHQLVSTSGTVVSINFCKDNSPWLRVDNETQGILHFHLESGAQTMSKHIPISNEFDLGNLISFTFEKCRKVVLWKFPDDTIEDSEGFIGFA